MKRSILDYLILITGSVFFIIFLKIYQGERLKSLFTLLSFVLFYIMWGFYHHLKDESLNLKTVIEYVFIGFTILLFLIVIFVKEFPKLKLKKRMLYLFKDKILIPKQTKLLPQYKNWNNNIIFVCRAMCYLPTRI